MNPDQPARCTFRPTLLGVALLNVILACPTAHAESLPDVVTRVLQEQPGVQSAQALLRAADSLITQARSDFLPTAGVSYRRTNANDETVGDPVDRNIRRSDANVRWNVFNGGADWSRYKSASYSRDAADADLDETQERLAAEITENYADVVRLRLTMASLQATLTRQESLAQRVATRVEAGRIPPTELDLLRSRHIQNQNLLGQLRTQLSTAEYRYRLLNGQAPDNLILPALQASADENDVDQVITRVRQHSGRLRAAEQRVAAREAEIGIARGSFAPTVELQFGKRLSNHTDPVPVTDTDRSKTLQVNLDIPLGGKNLARFNESRERYRAALFDAQQLGNDLARDTRDFHGQLEEMRKIANALEERVRAAQRVAAAYELHFDAGRRSLNDLASTLDELFDAQRSLIDNRARETVVLARLLSMENGLRAALNTRYQPAGIAEELLKSPTITQSIVVSPAPTAPPAVPGVTPDEELGTVLRQWASDWSRKDVDAYLKHYATDFLPANGATRAAWASDRQQKITRAENPVIQIQDIEIHRLADDRMITRFHQDYRAAHYADRMQKQLEWVKHDGVWRIVAETRGPGL